MFCSKQTERPTYPLPENPKYDENIEILLNCDPASASETFNPLVQKLVDNIHYAVLNASDTQLIDERLESVRSDLTEIEERMHALESEVSSLLVDNFLLMQTIFNDFGGTQYFIRFDTLDALTVTGIWNEALKRLEC